MNGEPKGEARSRAREETARIVRDAAAKSGTQMTQTQAQERVDRAMTRGDRIRENGHK